MKTETFEQIKLGFARFERKFFKDIRIEDCSRMGENIVIICNRQKSTYLVAMHLDGEWRGCAFHRPIYGNRCGTCMCGLCLRVGVGNSFFLITVYDNARRRNSLTFTVCDRFSCTDFILKGVFAGLHAMPETITNEDRMFRFEQNTEKLLRHIFQWRNMLEK